MNHVYLTVNWFICDVFHSSFQLSSVYNKIILQNKNNIQGRIIYDPAIYKNTVDYVKQKRIKSVNTRKKKQRVSRKVRQSTQNQEVEWVSSQENRIFLCRGCKIVSCFCFVFFSSEQVLRVSYCVHIPPSGRLSSFQSSCVKLLCRF